MAIKIRRGTDTARLAVIFEEGEVVYTTDTKSFFIGDGVTAGGNQIGGTTAASLLKAEVHNATGVTLTKGQVVYLSGNTGNKPNALLAQANSEATSSKTIGLIILNISNNASGDIATDGLLSDLNTSAFVAGDLLWLSDTIAGGLTTIIPDTPNHAVFIGYVVRAHATQGSILIHIQNGYELNEIHDVKITSVQNNDGLIYDTTLGYWKNSNTVTVQGNTFNAANKLVQLDGTAKLPAVDGSQLTNLPTPTTPTLATVTTAGNTTTNAITVGGLTVDTSLITTDTTNKRVSINAPIGSIYSNLFVESNSSTTNKTDYTLVLNNRNLSSIVGSTTGIYFANSAGGASQPYNVGHIVGSIVATAVTWNNITSRGYLSFVLNDSTNTQQEYIRINNNGNVGIGTTTDAGFKLDVNGTARVSGELFSGTYLGTQTSRVKLKGVTAGTIAAYYLVGEHGSNSQEQFYIREDGSSSFQNIIARGTLFVNSIEPRTSSTTLELKSFSGTTYGVALQNGFDFVHTTGQRSLFRLGQGFAPTSGTGVYNTIILDNTINQTGGANGITRGLYVNPTLTAAADFRAIETTVGGAYINTTSVQASAILQADSTTKGFLPPRMTTTQKNAIATPASGLVVYDTTLGKLCVRGAASWETITSI